jgi:hypothetical protein
MFKVRSRKPKSGTVANAEICRAVGERRVVRCVYGGGPERRIEPHCHGHGHAGQELLSAFQRAAAPGDAAAGWKMLNVEKLVAFDVTDERFEVQPDFNPEAPGVAQVHCQVRP